MLILYPEYMPVADYAIPANTWHNYMEKSF
jgi:hypothetical protein